VIYVNVITLVYNISYNLVSNGIEATYITLLNKFVQWDKMTCCNYFEFSRLEDGPIYSNQKLNMLITN